MKEQEEKIKKVIASIEETLIEKNKRYGSSTAKPINVFSGLDPIEGIKQRLDDKLKRIKTSTIHSKELSRNDVFDLMGYLVLLCVQQDWDDFSELID